ncbi:hypothetical protein CGQ36_20815 [Nocardiopsis dassonvillei]|nr:hypothetical protein CGQ36_20815 [Nocardiopsis dassonvillei]
MPDPADLIERITGMEEPVQLHESAPEAVESLLASMRITALGLMWPAPDLLKDLLFDIDGCAAPFHPDELDKHEAPSNRLQRIPKKTGPAGTPSPRRWSSGSSAWSATRPPTTASGFSDVEPAILQESREVPSDVRQACVLRSCSAVPY